MIEKWFNHHFSSFFESVLRKHSKSCPADHQRDRPRTLDLIKRLTEMIEKWFDHHFPSFFQDYSLRHKKIRFDLGGGSKNLTNFPQNFLKVYPLVPNVSQWIFSMKPFKWPLSILVWTGASFKIIEKKADLWSAKIERRFEPKKTFRLFLLRRLECFSRRKKIFEKSSNFFFISWRQTSKVGRARCENDMSESSAWHI